MVKTKKRSKRKREKSRKLLFPKEGKIGKVKKRKYKIKGMKVTSRKETFRIFG